MTSMSPLRCTYCGSVSDWSSELTEETEAAESHVCAECGQETGVWDGPGASALDDGHHMLWVAPDPLF